MRPHSRCPPLRVPLAGAPVSRPATRRASRRGHGRKASSASRCRALCQPRLRSSSATARQRAPCGVSPQQRTQTAPCCSGCTGLQRSWRTWCRAPSVPVRKATPRAGPCAASLPPIREFPPRRWCPGEPAACHRGWAASTSHRRHAPVLPRACPLCAWTCWCRVRSRRPCPSQRHLCPPAKRCPWRCLWRPHPAEHLRPHRSPQGGWPRWRCP
mmetsp:Transcript_92880/g.277136  ORF Transcript_92880/g.277136 Transcript_92880/m.277136 type:complete len:213 (+) Transcript_92880:701-1339(+)